jgi:hypothetical protein
MADDIVGGGAGGGWKESTESSAEDKKKDQKFLCTLYGLVGASRAPSARSHRPCADAQPSFETGRSQQQELLQVLHKITC